MLNKDRTKVKTRMPHMEGIRRTCRCITSITDSRHHKVIRRAHPVQVLQGACHLHHLRAGTTLHLRLPLVLIIPHRHLPHQVPALTVQFHLHRACKTAYDLIKIAYCSRSRRRGETFAFATSSFRNNPRGKPLIGHLKVRFLPTPAVSASVMQYLTLTNQN